MAALVLQLEWTKPPSASEVPAAALPCIAALWPTKILRNVSNGCFGEAAIQHLDIWPRSGWDRNNQLG